MNKRILLSIIVLLAVLPAQAGKTDRGLGDPKAVYIEKGTVQFGISGGYKTYGAEGLNGSSGTSLYGIVDNLSGQAKMGDFAVSGAWFIADNLSLGARFGYEQSNINLNSAKIMSFVDIQNRHLDALSLTGALFCRAYKPLFNSKILAIFGEGNIGGKRGYSKDYEVTDRGKLGTYSDNYSLAFELCSGLSVFVDNNCALTFSLPFLQIGKTWSKQIKEGEPQSMRSEVFADYTPDFLGINIGVNYTF